MYVAAVFVPLLGCAHRRPASGALIGDRAPQMVTSVLCMVLAAHLRSWLFFARRAAAAMRVTVDLCTWIEVGDFQRRLGAALRHADGGHGGDGQRSSRC